MLNYHEMKMSFPCIFEHRVKASQYAMKYLNNDSLLQDASKLPLR